MGWSSLHALGRWGWKIRWKGSQELQLKRKLQDAKNSLQAEKKKCLRSQGRLNKISFNNENVVLRHKYFPLLATKHKLFKFISSADVKKVEGFFFFPVYLQLVMREQL